MINEIRNRNENNHDTMIRNKDTRKKTKKKKVYVIKEEKNTK